MMQAEFFGSEVSVQHIYFDQKKWERKWLDGNKRESRKQDGKNKSTNFVSVKSGTEKKQEH